MTLTELQTEAHAQVRRLAANYGYADHDIKVDIRKPRFRRRIYHRAVTQYFCEEYGWSFEVLYSKTRVEKIRLPRQMAQYCMAKLCRISTAKIGKITGGRTHATVLNAVKRISNLMETDRKFEAEMRRNIERLLIGYVRK